MEQKENSKFRILIVDDISKNIQVLGNILRTESYQTGFATSGEQALASLKTNEFDLILLDIMMPGMDGYEVCRRIRVEKRLREIPIIFLTAKVDDESIVEGFKVGAQDYVTKPFNASELLARVKTHLELNDKRKQLAVVNTNLEEQVKERTKQLQEAVNELELANKKLNQLDKAKGDFLSIISHELRTPLNGILGFASILKLSMENEEQLEHLDYLLESANRLLRFSTTALLLAQLSVDQYRLDFKEENLQDILVSVIEQLDSGIKEKEIQLDIFYTGDNIIYRCDRKLIEIAFKSVLNNAVKYSPEKETITIYGKQEEGNIELIITDKGNGFSSEALDRLFQFFSSDQVMHHTEGLGLGLAASKLIMKAHGGDIQVENLEEGGARVIFTMKVVV